MKVTLESTHKVVELETADGARVPARIWEGTTESGIKVHAFVTRIAAPANANQEQFQRELKECRVPSADVYVYPARLVL